MIAAGVVASVRAPTRIADQTTAVPETSAAMPALIADIVAHVIRNRGWLRGSSFPGHF
jgi:hypothetical protein